ncbi:MAG: HAD family hydrolase [Dongiaceae bacterium]
MTRGKPAPDCFLLAARRLGVEPGHCLVWEDAPSGIAAAEAAGATVVVVTATHAHPMDTAHPTVTSYEGLAAGLDAAGRLTLASPPAAGRRARPGPEAAPPPRPRLRGQLEDQAGLASARRAAGWRNRPPAPPGAAAPRPPARPGRTRPPATASSACTPWPRRRSTCGRSGSGCPPAGRRHRAPPAAPCRRA